MKTTRIDKTRPEGRSGSLERDGPTDETGTDPPHLRGEDSDE